MKRKFQLVVGMLVIAMVMLACGSSTGVQVNTSPEGEKEVKATTPAKVGTSRTNPAPVGSEVIADEMAFMVLSVVRPADNLVRAGNPFNSTPDPNYEYIFVEIQVTCKKVSEDEKCSFTPLIDTKLLGVKGIEYDPKIIVGVTTILESTDFYSGAVISGHIPFIVGEDDTDLLLVFSPFLGDSFYLSLPQ